MTLYIFAENEKLRQLWSVFWSNTSRYYPKNNIEGNDFIGLYINNAANFLIAYILAILYANLLLRPHSNHSMLANKSEKLPWK